MTAVTAQLVPRARPPSLRAANAGTSTSVHSPIQSRVHTRRTCRTRALGSFDNGPRSRTTPASLSKTERDKDEYLNAPLSAMDDAKKSGLPDSNRHSIPGQRRTRAVPRYAPAP